MENVLAGQLIQAESVVCPVKLLYFPAAQAVNEPLIYGLVEEPDTEP